jgi:hypothetical protein
MSAEVKKLKKMAKKIELWIINNKACELKLVTGNQTKPPHDLNDATTFASVVASFTSAEQFSPSTTKLLQGFVSLREFNADGTPPAGW